MPDKLNVRLAAIRDAERIWEIRNSPAARLNSLNQQEIPLAMHIEWFKNKYFSGDKNICLVLEAGGVVVGYCRFDWQANQAKYLVSVAIDNEAQGRGYGSFLLSEALADFKKNVEIEAVIKKTNEASKKLFAKNGFEIVSEEGDNLLLRLAVPEKIPTAPGTLHKTIHSSKWVFSATVTEKVISLISFFLLTRLLDPQSYGLIAIILMLVGVFNRMVVTGFEAALIQKKEKIDEYLNVVWTFNLLKNILIFAVIYLGAPLVADFFHAWEAVNFIRWSGLFILIPSFVSLKQLYMFREFNFEKVYVRDISGLVGYVLVGSLWAIFISADVSALFFANVAKYFIPSVVIFLFYPAIPKLDFKFGKLRGLTPYSKWVTMQNIVNYLFSISDNFLVGRMLSPVFLGYYSRARNLAGEALSPISAMLKNLSFVAFSKVQDKTDKILQGYLLGLDLVFFFGFSNIFVAWLGADPIIRFFLGEKWSGVIVPLQILTLYAMNNSITEMAATLFDGAGKPSVNVKIKTLSLIIYTLLSFLGIYFYGIIGAAVGVACSSVLIIFYIFYKLRSIYRLKFQSVLNRSLLVLLPLVFATVVFYPIFSIIAPWHYLQKIIVLGLYYWFFLLLFWLLGRRYEQGSFKTMMLILQTLKSKNA